MTAGRSEPRDEREEQAIAWLVRLTGEDARLEDWRAHEAWLAADPANARTYANVEALWADLDEQAEPLRRALADEASNVVVPLPVRRARPATAPIWRWAAVAAGLLIAAGGYLGYRQMAPTIYTTAAGQTRAVTLADGSRIVLNGASTLSVRYDAGARRVTMADAEADFDVVRDAARPFVITAGDRRIAVLGTAFDVASHDGGLTVTVRRGAVAVGRAAPDGGLADPVRVPAGFRLERAANGTSAISAVDPADAIAWRQGRLISHGERLSKVADALSRAFATPVQVRGVARDMTFTGVLVLDDEGAVVRRLQAFLPLDADRSNGAIVLSSRP